MTILSPASFVPTRQVIVSGRAAQNLTQIGLDVSDAVLVYRFSGQEGTLPTTFHAKTGGYFALQMDPTRGFPDVSGAGTVTLELTLTLTDGSDHILTSDQAELSMTLAERAITVAGQALTARHLPGAPVTMDLSLDPVAPALRGHVFLGGNPATPANGLTVTVGALGDVTTNADGMFDVGPLPLTDSVAVSISDGTDSVDLTHFTDFTEPLNTAIFAFQPDTD